MKSDETVRWFDPYKIPPINVRTQESRLSKWIRDGGTGEAPRHARASPNFGGLLNNFLRKVAFLKGKKLCASPKKESFRCPCLTLCLHDEFLKLIEWHWIWIQRKSWNFKNWWEIDFQCDLVFIQTHKGAATQLFPRPLGFLAIELQKAMEISSH